MKVILLKDVKDIGHADTLKDVSDGYARNFLIPNGLAIPAEKTALKNLDSRVKAKAEKHESEKAELMKLASKLKGSHISITVDVGENGKMFGSVTTQDISKKVFESLGMEIDKHKIILDQPIKALGVFDVPVKFGHEVTASVKVNVSASSK
jgi:large subunit ribosomal protein L9